MQKGKTPITKWAIIISTPSTSTITSTEDSPGPSLSKSKQTPSKNGKHPWRPLKLKKTAKSK